ncbi:MAG: hypothetical protein LBL69_03615, partial [Zoogloeaceae bacterium]|nr:hypothetical protein [Zoogloeaceae bacterium]
EKAISDEPGGSFSAKETKKHPDPSQTTTCLLRGRLSAMQPSTLRHIFVAFHLILKYLQGEYFLSDDHHPPCLPAVIPKPKPKNPAKIALSFRSRSQHITRLSFNKNRMAA